MERLFFFLKRLKCPNFLFPNQKNVFLSFEFRKTFVIWLFAVYHKPELRQIQDESWTKHEGTTAQLLSLLQNMVLIIIRNWSIFCVAYSIHDLMWAVSVSYYLKMHLGIRRRSVLSSLFTRRRRSNGFCHTRGRRSFGGRYAFACGNCRWTNRIRSKRDIRRHKTRAADD